MTWFWTTTAPLVRRRSAAPRIQMPAPPAVTLADLARGPAPPPFEELDTEPAPRPHPAQVAIPSALEEIDAAWYPHAATEQYDDSWLACDETTGGLLELDVGPVAGR